MKNTVLRFELLEVSVQSVQIAATNMRVQPAGQMLLIQDAANFQPEKRVKVGH